MAIILTGDSLNRKVYQDDTNYNRTIEVQKKIQPVRRKINGAAVAQHVLIEEYTLRDIDCVNADACGTSRVESPVAIKLRVSGPVGSTKLAELHALLTKAVAGSGNAGSPVLTAVKSW